MCGINHRSAGTAGRCKDCQSISAQRAAEAARNERIEQVRRAALTDEQRRVEDRSASLDRWSIAIEVVLLPAILIAMCMGSWVTAGLLFGAFVTVLGCVMSRSLKLATAKQAAIDGARKST